MNTNWKGLVLILLPLPIAILPFGLGLFLYVPCLVLGLILASKGKSQKSVCYSFSFICGGLVLWVSIGICASGSGDCSIIASIIAVALSSASGFSIAKGSYYLTK